MPSGPAALRPALTDTTRHRHVASGASAVVQSSCAKTRIWSSSSHEYLHCVHQLPPAMCRTSGSRRC